MIRLSAERAQHIIDRTKDKKSSEVDNTVTKALGVLQENGIYACFLYLLAKEKENDSVVVDEILNLLAGLGLGRDEHSRFHLTAPAARQLKRKALCGMRRAITRSVVVVCESA